MCGILLMGEDALHDPGAIMRGSQGAEGEFGGVQIGVENVAAVLCWALGGQEPWVVSGLRACEPRQGSGCWSPPVPGHRGPDPGGAAGMGAPGVPGLRGRDPEAVEGARARLCPR